MTGAQRHTPHPFVTQRTLWAVDVPDRVKWTHLQEVLKVCGNVKSGGKSTTPEGRQRWAITFSNVNYAEMALATLNGVIVPSVDPPWTLTLSHTSSLDSPLPKEPLCPQCVKIRDEDHPLQHATPQEIFTWFRVAGPLVSVHTNVNVGYPKPTCVVQYWEEKHALVGLRKARFMQANLRAMPWFLLRTIAPWAVSATNLGTAFRGTNIPEIFGKFGTIIHSKAVNVGKQTSGCYVSFMSREEASAAVTALNQTTRSGRKIIVRILELQVQEDFLLQNSGENVLAPHRVSPSEGPSTQSTSGSKESDRPSPRDESHAREEEARRKRAEAAHLEEEARRKRVEAEYQDKLADIARKRKAAVEATNDARLKRLDAEATEQTAKASLAEAKVEREEATSLAEKAASLAVEAAAALAAAQKALDDACAHQRRVSDRLSAAATVEMEADGEAKAAFARRLSAERAEATVLEEQRRVEREEQALLDSVPPEVVEARRREQLEESMRKLKELRETEEAEQRERERQGQQKKQESERRKKEQERLVKQERERQAREETERKAREERERQEAEARPLNAYKLAAAKEIERCQKRDAMSKIFGSQWTDALSVRWFKTVSAEFDEIKFCGTQPLVIESVPWPLLSPPNKMSLEDVEWGAVEDFFAAAKRVVDPNEYKGFVEKAHRRFHPDRWKSRGILDTVLDEELRRQLENAGNVVAQAITPIWLQTKSK